ncbi:MAG: ABC transporter permease [Oscillospiraceae bacterium]|nr:ABC transporter permease [Oscillospiraceae bacterium]
MESTYKKKSQIADVWSRFKRNKMALAGLIVLVVMIILAIFADVIADFETEVIRQNIPNRLQTPCAQHWFGTDEFGRDIFARIVHGTRISLQVGVISVGIALIVGGFLGAIAGFYGGAIDNVIMRIMDVFLAVPGMLLAIAIVAALGSSMTNLMVAVGISSMPSYARILRASVLSVKDMEFVEASRAIGAKNMTIIMSHIIPNSLAPVIVQSTLGVAGAILATAALSFIGLGIQPPNPEWGAMLSSGRAFMRDHPHVVLFPGLSIMLTILVLNMIGDGLRDALDPRLK